jgi:hypothetical protein
LKRELLQLFRFFACLMAMWGHASAFALNSAIIIACVEPSGGTHLEFMHDPARPIGEIVPAAEPSSPADHPAISGGRCLHEHLDAYKSRRDVPTGDDLKWVALEPLPCLVGVRSHGARGGEHAWGTPLARTEPVRLTLRI